MCSAWRLELWWILDRRMDVYKISSWRWSILWIVGVEAFCRVNQLRCDRSLGGMGRERFGTSSVYLYMMAA